MVSMKSPAATELSRSPSELKFRKALPVSLREAGFGEAWLQAQIAKDTSLLGLGELLRFRKRNRRLLAVAWTS